MNELIQKVEQWAIDRNLHMASPQGQALKVVEEFTEMLIAYEDYESANEVIDGIGDTYVTLIILCEQIDMNFKELLEITKHQYSENDFSLTDCQFTYRSLNDLSTGLSKGNTEKIESSIIDIIATANVLAGVMEETPEECLSVAYEEIKDRKGRMIDGVFVKESDLMSSSLSEIEELARQYALTLSENGEGDDEIGETAFHILKLDKRSGKRSDYTPLKKIHYDTSDIYDLVGTQEDFVIFVKFNFIGWLTEKEG